MNERQARAVVEYTDQEDVLGTQESVREQKLLQGIVVLMWQEYRTESAIHFLWINCSSEACKNICIDAYGYAPEEVAGLFSTMFSAMSHGIPQMESKKLLCVETEHEDEDDLEIQ